MSRCSSHHSPPRARPVTASLPPAPSFLSHPPCCPSNLPLPDPLVPTFPAVIVVLPSYRPLYYLFSFLSGSHLNPETSSAPHALSSNFKSLPGLFPSLSPLISSPLLASPYPFPVPLFYYMSDEERWPSRLAADLPPQRPELEINKFSPSRVTTFSLYLREFLD